MNTMNIPFVSYRNGNVTQGGILRCLFDIDDFFPMATIGTVLAEAVYEDMVIVFGIGDSRY
jgi:hypothetical protein